MYNEKRRIEHDNNQQIKFNKHMKDFCDKYLQDEEMWEFETLSIFLNNNPFKKVYTKIKKFEDVKNGDNWSGV